jgi:uncharacterized repeat protein (TIGR03803 family)
LIQGQDGLLYGIGAESIFKLDVTGSGFKLLHTFTNNPVGFAPIGKMIQGNDSFLYGTTFGGGSNNAGAVFKLDTNGNNYSVLHNFKGTPDGAQPYAGLLQGSDGALYGTTRVGGVANRGSIFKLNPDGGNYTNLYSFNNTPDGNQPFGSLTQDPGDVIYGTTSAGGLNGNGTVFKINPDGSGYQVLYSFGNSPDGDTPKSDLVAGVFTGNTGVLYGTTDLVGGGGNSAGTIFAILINPPLTIIPVSGSSGSQTVVFWPEWAFNYVLQTTTNLASGTWTNVPNAVPVISVQLTNTPSPAFFRLIRQ